jgi:hypothetical protein
MKNWKGTSLEKRAGGHEISFNKKLDIWGIIYIIIYWSVN